MKNQNQSQVHHEPADPQPQTSPDLFNDIAQQIAVLVVRSHRRRQAQAGKIQPENALNYEDGKS
jgi:hypothetical protein